MAEMGTVFPDPGAGRREAFRRLRTELAGKTQPRLGLCPHYAERRAIWERMLEINADQIYSIEAFLAVPQPIVVNRNLRNVPEKGIFNWNPGAHFGVYTGLPKFGQRRLAPCKSVRTAPNA